MPEKDAVLHYVAEGITRITLNRPQALNARDPGPVAKRVGIPGLGGGAGRGRGGGGRSPDRPRGAGKPLRRVVATALLCAGLLIAAQTAWGSLIGGS